MVDTAVVSAVVASAAAVSRAAAADSPAVGEAVSDEALPDASESLLEDETPVLAVDPPAANPLRPSPSCMVGIGAVTVWVAAPVAPAPDAGVDGSEGVAVPAPVDGADEPADSPA
ncbi:hypothetical protein [Mycolicibacterium sp. 050158]|uniref:hypothetical protein n=1 Tax=Mycolicibacterium sp. 050158 TaxID=3090602 RepID=UPI00299D01E1|nr:hypothetical protein [Mycolicibacterium sp. 050158]MDX1889536.1 hypothetical protein [Mycolicibacterium sp. 050158]